MKAILKRELKSYFASPIGYVCIAVLLALFGLQYWYVMMIGSSDYIYIFEDNKEIVGVILPDGDSFNSCIKKGYEKIFSKMLDLSEKKLLPLFKKDENGEIDFLVISHDSLEYQAEELIKRGYVKDDAEDYDNVQHPMETNYQITLPQGFQQVYGEQLDDHKKAKACHYGFQPADDDGILVGAFREGLLA